MKNKSSRHKDANTFKFQPFSERISNIDVDVFHRVGHEYEESEEEECNFFQAIEKWNVLNLTEGYDAFKREVKAYGIITLPQLIHSKETVVRVLLKHLNLKNPLCLQPLLDIVVAVAKDLRNDFYAYYPDFLDILIQLLKTQDTDQLEWTFQCLAYLFKFLWRSLIKDINTVFKALLPLLSDSNPQYINNFAAESFAFVARKVKDRTSFLYLVLKAVKQNQDGVTGCGKLLFEVIKGVTGQFHSCAETILPFLLESLNNDKLPQNELFEILEEVVKNIAHNIYPHKSELLWTTYCNLINNLGNNWINDPNEKNSQSLNLVVALVGQSVEHKGGKLLQNSAQLTTQLTKILSLPNISDDVLLNCVKITILLLLSNNIKLSQEQASGLTYKILNLKSDTVLLYFYENISKYPTFEALILPRFLNYCVQNKFEKQAFRVLAQMITTKSPLCCDGILLPQWSKYTIDFGSQHNISVKQLMQKSITETIDYNNFDLFVSALICIPHLNVKTDDFKNTLQDIFEKLCCDLHTENIDFKKQLYLINLILECIIHISSNVQELVSLKDVLLEEVLPFCDNPNCIVALKTLDLFVASITNLGKELDLKMLLRMHSVLEKNFNSPYHNIRLLSAHIYSLFEHNEELTTTNSNSEQWNLFSIIYRVESISPQVDTYRDQLNYLEKLTYDKPQMEMCKHSEFATLPLRYLCGVLYMNFQLLWDPVCNIITSHAYGLEISIFWKVFVEQLKSAVENVKCAPVVEVDLLVTEFTFIGDLYQNAYLVDDKLDFRNMRLLLWKAMTLFPEVAESRTRDVSELLLNYIEEEYTKSNSDSASSWNIKQNTTDAVDETMEVDEEPTEDETEIIKKELTTPAARSGAKNNLKLLLQHLQVFSKVKSPKSMYKETELYKLYFDFLSHKNWQVQKAALDCIMTYKFKYLVPYQQHLYGLIDDKNFKNELATFRVDTESSIIQPEHRENLIPVVMKIVFSKMTAKTGLRTGGKSSGQFRRNLILRFLAGCKPDEMLNFIHMAFKFYIKYFNDDTEGMVANISQCVKLDAFVPPKRLQSTVNMLTVVLEQFGNLMGDDLLRFVLKVLLCVGANIKGALSDYENIHAGYLSILRNLRTSCIKLVQRFFYHFENYPWTIKEINAVFDVFVFPYLNKLNIEGIHSPTSLLKLLCLWGTNPKYFPLLVKHEKDDKTMYALSHVITLLVNPKSHSSVSTLIMETVEKLLSLTLNVEEMETALEIENELPIHETILEKIKINEKLNYGSCILLPHVPLVLAKIKRKLESKAKNINRRELFILSRISELVWEADTSDQIIQLLLPILLKKCTTGSDDESIHQLVSTANNLIKNITVPEKHLPQLSPLFGYISNVPSRKTLCDILSRVTSNCEPSLADNLKTATHMILEVNSFDAKWVDQPDFQRRLDALQKIQTMATDGTLTLELGILIIYNCYYLFTTEKDLSLKDNASFCLKTITPYLIKKHEQSQQHKSYILNDTLLKLIRNGLKNKRDDIRNECISLLGHIARECATAHVVLRDLNKLTSKEDMEVDFFENLTHLQTHRHGKALLRITQVLKLEKTLPNMQSLTNFLLPLTTHYLCSEKFMNKHSLVDTAIEAIGTICKLLPWHQYEALLKFYLTKLRFKMEYQKQLVKLIVRILDSFHYDLSKGDFESIKSVVKNNKVKLVVQTEEVKEVVEEIAKEEVGEESETVKEDLEDIFEDDKSEGDEEDAEEVVNKEVLICDKTTILCKSAATRVTKTIQVVLLPQLHKTLAQMTTHDSSHKVNRKRTGAEREDEDLLRVPISLAVVKLLQRLPKVILDTNLPGVFMKLCTFLKSQLESVRRTARETLQKIMIALGPEYLEVLLEEMSTLLSKGFQIHVLVYTVHSVLCTLKEMYKVGDIDKILTTVLKLCSADLFGALSEEKEVRQIITKTSEAKSTKSFDTLQILAQYISDKCLMDLILPIKNVLASTHSFKVTNKAQECLRHIALGLVDNEFVQIMSLLMFAYGTSSKSIPQLLNKEKPVLTEKEREKLQRQRPDCLIIPKAPVGNSGYRLNKVRTNAKTNAHVLVEFGLRLFHFMLKRDKFRGDDYMECIDPFVEVFKDCLTSQHVKLCTVTLQCLQWIMKYDMPSLHKNIQDICKSIFSILHKYAAAGLSKGDNFDLVVAAFKAMAVLVRDAKYHMIETDQLKMLLLYVEQDLYDHDRQAIAFGLLKAIIARKLSIPEMHSILSKVSELSITSELTHVRLQARVVFHQYLMDYPLEKKLAKLVNFYVAQLNYEMQYGRESALSMIQSIIHSFPINKLKEFSGTFFITLGAQLVNDEVPECRKMAADCISSMLTRLPKNEKDKLFDIILSWLNDTKVQHKRLAAQLCGIFINVEKSDFDSRIISLTPLILQQFGLDTENKPGKFVRIKSQPTEETEGKERVLDHHLYQVLQMILKLCAQCPAFLNQTDHIENLSAHVQTLLAHPHEWVRLSAAKFLGFILSALDIEKLSKLLITKQKLPVGYLHTDPVSNIKSLTLDLCAQLQPSTIKPEMAEQVIKNLVFIARVLENVPMNTKHEDDQNIHLLWLVKRMRKIVNQEVVENANCITLRTEVFKWIAAVVTVIDLKILEPIMHHLLAPLVREMITTEESNAPIRQLSKEVGNLIKKLVGLEEYSKKLALIQRQLTVKRAERKRSRVQLAVTDPEMYAKKKIKLNEKKKVAKKNKMERMKGTFKKPKRKTVELKNDEIM